MNIDPTAPLKAQLRAHDLAEHCPGDTALLYRFRDIEGSLLYVGVTVNPPNRWQAHRSRSEWWPLVASVEVEHHPYMNAALDAELAAIRGESPRFNRRSVVECPAGDSATSCGMSPQGKGREGKRKGMEGNAAAILVCGSSVDTSQNQVKSVTRDDWTWR